MDHRPSPFGTQGSTAWRVVSAVVVALTFASLDACGAGSPGIGNRGGAWPGGIGATLRHRETEGVLVLEAVPERGPAYRAGLRSGDRIVAVDGTTVRGHSTQDIAPMLRGNVGTTVVLRVVHDGGEVDVPVERAPYVRDAGR